MTHAALSSYCFPTFFFLRTLHSSRTTRIILRFSIINDFHDIDQG